MEKHHKFLDFNGNNIYYLNADGKYWVAIKPICQALNVAYAAQLRRIKKDHILRAEYTKQTIQLPKSNKKNEAVLQGREMICLPENYVYGWIFSINSDSKELIEYKKTCHDLIWKYFRGSITNRNEILIERNEIENEISYIHDELQSTVDKYHRLQKLKKQKSKLTSKLNVIDKEVVNQYKLNFNSN